jgi:steroid delta-isomerase-like uncharacterized protein
MSEQEHLQASRQAFAALNAHDLECFVGMLDEAFVWESDTLPNPIAGREAAQCIMQIYYRAFPDLHITIEEELASGSFVIARWNAVGTQQGRFLALAPTNRRAKVHGCSIAEFKDGRVVHLWTYWDTGFLLQQLGVLGGDHRTPQQVRLTG